MSPRRESCWCTRIPFFHVRSDGGMYFVCEGKYFNDAKPQGRARVSFFMCEDECFNDEEGHTLPV